MKKGIISKFLLLIVACCTFSFCVNNVFAVTLPLKTKTGKAVDSQCNDFEVSFKQELYLGGGAKTTKKPSLLFGSYSAKNGSKCALPTEYYSYCIDPGKHGPNGATGALNYVRSTNYGELDVRADGSWGEFSRAVMYIYTLYKDKGDVSDDYLTANIAVRLLTFHYGLGKNTNDAADAYAQTAIKIDDGTYSAYITGGTVGTAMYPKDAAAKTLLQNVEKLYKEAIQKAIDKTGVSTKFNFKFGAPAIAKMDLTETQYTAEITVPVTGLDTFSGIGAIVKNFKITSCPTGATCTLINTPPAADENIIGKKDAKGIYTYTIKITGPFNALAPKGRKCDAKVSVSIEYYNAGDDSNAFIVQLSSSNPGKTSTDYQRMVLFTKPGSAALEKVTLPDIAILFNDFIKPGDYAAGSDITEFYYSYCDDCIPGEPSCPLVCYETPTLDPTDPAFDAALFEEAGCCDSVKIESITDPVMKAAAIAACPSDDCVKSTLPVFCDDIYTEADGRVTVSIKEGYDETTGAIDYAKCVINKNDLADNPNTIMGFEYDAATGQQDNPYCTVSCIEDWEMRFPNKKFTVANGTEIKAGQYFALDADVKGTRTCVSNTEINYPKFHQDVADINVAAIASYNVYNYWAEAVKAPNTASNIVKTTLSAAVYTISGTHADTCSYTATQHPHYKPQAYDPTTGAPLPLEIDHFTYTCDSGGTLVGYSCQYACTLCDDSSATMASGYCFKANGTKSCNAFTLTWNNVPQYKFTPATAAGTVSAAASINSKDADERTLGTLTTTGSHASAGHPEGVTCTYATSVTQPPVADWSSIISGYQANANAAQAAYDNNISQVDELIDYINACSEWENDFDYDPLIEYSYEEDFYMNMIRPDNFMAVFDSTGLTESDATKITEDVFCNGKADDKSFACSSASQANSFPKINKNYVKCESESCDLSNSQQIPTNVSIKKAVTYKAKYKPFSIFYTVHSSGDIVMAPSDNATLIEPYYLDGTAGELNGHVLPIKLNTAAGLYEYTLTVSQVGQYNDVPAGGDDSLGRIFGSPDSVYSVMDISSDGTYIFACIYEVIEETCICCGTGDSIDSRIDIEPGHVYPPVTTEGNISFTYRPVSLNNLFPGGITPGTNWDNPKGQATLLEINNAGENAYIVPEYSYIVDPSGTATLQEYNSSENYADFNLKCSDYGRKCTSVLLDEITSGSVNGVEQLARNTGFTTYTDGTSWK